jgi:hypothetical protein
MWRVFLFLKSRREFVLLSSLGQPALLTWSAGDEANGELLLDSLELPGCAPEFNAKP